MTVILLLAAAAIAANPYTGARNERAGAKIYARHCSSCHGDAGQGIGRAPALRSPAVRALPDAALFQLLKNGVIARGMPSWAHLPEARLWQVVAYIRSLR